VIVVVVIAVATVSFSRALVHLASIYTLRCHSMPVFPAMKRLTVSVSVSVSVTVGGVNVFVNVVVDGNTLTLRQI
jgi:hypothetical protein